MKKIILYMATSIDGFVARCDGSVDWLNTELDISDHPDLEYKQFLERVDTIIMGRKSYDQVLSFGEWGYPEHECFVMSRSKTQFETPNTTQLDTNIAKIQALKEQEGKDIWLFGGGEVNRFFLEHDLIDEMILFVQPTVLGAGISLFGGSEVAPKTFTRKEARELSGGYTALWFQR